jgi:hypothetical protein
VRENKHNLTRSNHFERLKDLIQRILHGHALVIVEVMQDVYSSCATSSLAHSSHFCGFEFFQETQKIEHRN